MLATAIGGAFLLHASIDPAEDTAIAPTRHEALAGLSSWSDRSQSENIADLATTSFDLVIVDPSPTGSVDAGTRAARVNALKFKPDGERRIVLAPLTIGEAEDHRAYWNNRWAPAPELPAVVRRLGDQAGQSPTSSTPADPRPARLATSPLVPADHPPSWLAEDVSERPGHWHVRYWMPGWQSVLFGSEDAMLDTIISAGFDGIVLDRADVHTHWSKQHPDARADMIGLVESLSRYARAKAPGFIVVLKDAEDLLNTVRVRNTVDAVIKQDLLFGRDGLAKSGNDRDVAASLSYLERAKRDGLPVMVAEYPANDPSSVTARDRLLAHGFIPHVGQRQEKRRPLD